jgi:hypothetical protein
MVSRSSRRSALRLSYRNDSCLLCLLFDPSLVLEVANRRSRSYIGAASSKSDQNLKWF